MIVRLSTCHCPGNIVIFKDPEFNVMTGKNRYCNQILLCLVKLLAEIVQDFGMDNSFEISSFKVPLERESKEHCYVKALNCK